MVELDEEAIRSAFNKVLPEPKIHAKDCLYLTPSLE
jgi:hypothetical protein